jgi:hypothetical protein
VREQIMGDIAAALQEAQRWLDSVPGVAAVGETECDGRPCIYVYVTSPEAAAQIPAELQGHRVVIQSGEPIQAQEPPRPR